MEFRVFGPLEVVGEDGPIRGSATFNEVEATHVEDSIFEFRAVEYAIELIG